MAPIDRLSALDLTFLDLETPQAPLHVGWTMRLEGPAPGVAALRRHIDGRLDGIPRFRRHIVRGSLLADPHWADDPAFDIANHVHGLTLGAPGGQAELRELAGRLFSQPLDPSRPLWRMYLVDGLANGGFALIGQAHHALVDGIAAVEVAMLLFDGADASPAAAAGGSGWRPTQGPSSAAVARTGLQARARGVARGSAALARALAATTPETLREAREAIGAIAQPAPATSLDHTAGRERVVAFADVALAAARDAGRRHGGTVNDVLLAASTIALGRALRRRGERPASLKAMVPVNTRTEEQAGALGNRISFMPVDLPVCEDDPRTVLRTVRARTKLHKAAGAAGPLEALAQAADLLPGPARRLVTRAAAQAAPFNAVVSNLPGPPVPLSVLGRRLLTIHPAVPLLHGHAIAIGALSYRDRLHVGLYADAVVMPDVLEVARDLEAAFDALRLVPAAAPTPWRDRARARRDQRAAARR